VISPRHIRYTRHLDEERGQALVEFAIVVVPLMLIIVAIVQFGFWFQARSALRDGVRAAARQASLCRSLGTNPTQASVQQSADSVYHGIVNSSAQNPQDPSFYWGAAGTSIYSCTAGTPVTVTGSYNYPINILGIVNIPGTSLTATAESIVE
jgi:Flp pilus assembly protein TadG